MISATIRGDAALRGQETAVLTVVVSECQRTCRVERYFQLNSASIPMNEMPHQIRWTSTLFGVFSPDERILLKDEANHRVKQHARLNQSL